MPYSSAAGQPDEGPTIQTLEQFKTVTTLSLNTPIIVYATDGSDESVDRELVTGVHGTGGHQAGPAGRHGAGAGAAPGPAPPE